IIVYIDLQSQNGQVTDAQLIFVSSNQCFPYKARDENQRQLELLPQKELENKSHAHTRINLAKDISRALEISNLCGHNHLNLQTLHPRELLKGVK
ncbi:histidinol dehydrogenase, partial [Campylobacter jejuni]|uniref:histidinol dehydrogenase n=1 Tax=Campylobacter jejuni TaxID=197 RepID=UPI002B22C999